MGNEQVEAGNLGEHAGEIRRVLLIGESETISQTMYSPSLLKEVLEAFGKQLVDDGRLDSVSLYSSGPTADFPEVDTRIAISKEICSTQSRSRKPRKSIGC